MRLKHFLWHLLNVFLPIVATAATFYFAYMAKDQSIDNAVIAAFSGGDNFIVAAIVLAAIMNEILDSSKITNNFYCIIKDVSIILIVVLIFIFAFMFGAVKFYSFLDSVKSDKQYIFAMTSIMSLALGCCIAFILKTTMAIMEARAEKNGN